MSLMSARERWVHNLGREGELMYKIFPQNHINKLSLEREKNIFSTKYIGSEKKSNPNALYEERECLHNYYQNLKLFN